MNTPFSRAEGEAFFCGLLGLKKETCFLVQNDKFFNLFSQKVEGVENAFVLVFPEEQTISFFKEKGLVEMNKEVEQLIRKQKDTDLAEQFTDGLISVLEERVFEEVNLQNNFPYVKDHRA